jgi:hypothetical protein
MVGLWKGAHMTPQTDREVAQFGLRRSVRKYWNFPEVALHLCRRQRAFQQQVAVDRPCALLFVRRLRVGME